MGELSEYYEDFPEEDPANQVNGVYDPEGARRVRAEAKRREQVDEKSKALRRKFERMADEAKQRARKQSQ